MLFSYHAGHMHTYVVCKCGHVWKVSDCVGTCVLSFNYSAIFFTISSALIGLMTSHDLRFDTSSNKLLYIYCFFLLGIPASHLLFPTFTRCTTTHRWEILPTDSKSSGTSCSPIIERWKDKLTGTEKGMKFILCLLLVCAALSPCCNRSAETAVFNIAFAVTWKRHESR